MVLHFSADHLRLDSILSQIPHAPRYLPLWFTALHCDIGLWFSFSLSQVPAHTRIPLFAWMRTLSLDTVGHARTDLEPPLQWNLLLTHTRSLGY